MARRLTPYQYRPGKSPLHRLSAGIKLLGLFTVSLCVLVPSPLFLIPPALLVLTGALAAGIRPWKLLRGSAPLIVLTGTVLVFRSIQWDPAAFSFPGFLEGCRFAGIIVITFCAGALLFSVTTMTELKDALDTLEGLLFLPILRLLKKNPGKTAPQKVRRQNLINALGQRRLSLGISLMLGFIPRFFDIWENADLAYEARGGKKNLSRLVILIPLVTERMMKAASETAEALESRGL